MSILDRELTLIDIHAVNGGFIFHQFYDDKSNYTFVYKMMTEVLLHLNNLYYIPAAKACIINRDNENFDFSNTLLSSPNHIHIKRALNGYIIEEPYNRTTIQISFEDLSKYIITYFKGFDFPVGTKIEVKYV